MAIAFFGLPLAALLLHADGHPISLAVLSPIAAPGARRLRRLLGPERVFDARQLGVRLESLVTERLVAAPPELVVSWFWTRRLPAAFRAAALGAIGVHPSLLPRHRGPNPFFAAIDAGDDETGVTVHRLEDDYDTGAILAQRRIAVADRDAWQLARALDRPSLAALRDVVARLRAGHLLAESSQDEQAATWAPEPTGELCRCDFGWPTARVLRRLRALAPVPGLALDVAGRRLSVTRAAPAREILWALLPGEAAAAAGELTVRTGDGAIALLGAVDDDTGEMLEAHALASLIADRRTVMLE